MTHRDESPLERASRALAAAAPPVGFRATQDELPDVAPGQLWRARRGARSLLALIVAVDEPMVELVPVTIEDGSNSDAIDLEPSASVLEAPLTVWQRLAASVPMRTLEQYVGVLLLEVPGDSVLAKVLKASRLGPAAVSASDDTLVLAARLRDSLNELASAPLPGGTGELPSLLRASGKRGTELGQLLGMPSSEVLELRRGERPLTAEQAKVLAPVLGRDEEELLAANPAPPEPLVAWMSRPRQRRRVIALAKVKHLDEDRAFLHATFSSYALAARTAGNRDGESKWAAVGERYFQSVLDES